MSSGRCDEGPRNCGAHTPLATPDTDLESGMVGDPWDGEQERVWKPDWVWREAGRKQPTLAEVQHMLRWVSSPGAVCEHPQSPSGFGAVLIAGTPQ